MPGTGTAWEVIPEGLLVVSHPMELRWTGLGARVAATQQIPTRFQTGNTQLFDRIHRKIATGTREQQRTEQKQRQIEDSLDRCKLSY